MFLAAVIKAVDEYQDLLRISVASAGNDHRLGANEAPPAIISMFLGEELTEVLDALASGKERSKKKTSAMEIGVKALPHFQKDTTDRNRTSPFAFTGNKFEFRMPGSSVSIAGVNTVLNTIVAQSLSSFADTLENADAFNFELDRLIKSELAAHKRIIFNGNNYSSDWTDEAKKRGLLNLTNTVEALPYLLENKNVELFTSHHVYSASELHSRYEILLESYSKTIRIEALTLVDMVKKEILPSALKYQRFLAETATSKNSLGLKISVDTETALIESISSLCVCAYKKLTMLEDTLLLAGNAKTALDEAKFTRDNIFAALTSLRAVIDELETLTAKEFYPYPSYATLLYSVR